MSSKKLVNKSIGSVGEKKGNRNHRAQLQAQASDISIALSEIYYHNTQNREIENPRDRQLLLSFRGNTATGIHQSVTQYLKDESLCADAIFLSIYPGDEFRLFSALAPLSKAGYPGVSQVLQKKAPVLLDKNLDNWKNIFKFTPTAIALIPIILRRAKTNVTSTDAIAVLGFQDTLPMLLSLESSWSTLIEFCQLTGPLLVNVKRYEEAYGKVKRAKDTLQAINDIEIVIRDISSCINTIGLELQTFFGATHAVVFIIQDQFLDSKMLKYSCFGGGNINDKCPNRDLHGLEEISQVPSTPVGWTATNRKCFRANSPSELEKFKLSNRPTVIHSVAGCIVSNIMCISIYDFVEETPLVIEMSDKVGGFSVQNEAEINLFAKRVSCVLSTAVLLDYRRKACRRTDITNEVLNNIKAVQFTKVKQLLDMKFRYSHSFQKKFFTFSYVVRTLPSGQIPGLVLYMFTELGFVTRWKIRRATLIRFILSIKQGYKDNPYHNWKHACTVTHFAYMLLKKLDLQKHGIMTDMEAFAFFVACICHDVDHRGVNNHFGISADMESYQLYKQEESVMERHHIAVTLQVLTTDDCNILESLSDAQYQEFVDLIQYDILATDLGKYLQSRNALFATLRSFDPTSKDCRRTLMSVLMIVVDLCETVKPWNEYIQTVKSIFSEFFQQGDDEIKHGFNPTPIMDRKTAYIPYIEMKFINEIVRPAYQIIAELLPKTEVCLQTIDYYKELWLVATQVFDDNTHVQDPLQILDSYSMKEENLTRQANRELEKHVLRIRQSQASLGLNRASPMGQLKNSSSANLPEYLGFGPVGEEEDFQKTSCCESFRKLLCCYKCRRKALFDAAFITKHHKETEFMEVRSECYERKRNSTITSDTFKNDRMHRIHSLINPDPIDLHPPEPELTSSTSTTDSTLSKGSKSKIK